jgi:hypothetical protein
MAEGVHQHLLYAADPTAEHASQVTRLTHDSQTSSDLIENVLVPTKAENNHLRAT